MTCRSVRLPGGVTAIVCTRSRRPVKCFYCATPHSRMCDYDIGNGKACSRKLCVAHAHTRSDDNDLCPDHAHAAPATDLKTGLKIWTGTTYWHRADPDALDVTVMTGGVYGRPFAPSISIFKPVMKAREEVERLEAVAALHEHIDPIKAREIREEAARLKLDAWVTYKRQYLAEMLVSSGRSPPEEWARDVARAKDRGVVPHIEAWRAELSRDRRAYLCYCPPEKRDHCHVFLLATVFTRLGATYIGELDKPARSANQLSLLK